MTKLSRQLTLLDAFCMASGAMISSGLFILPSLIYAKSGSSVILVYLVASLLVVPALLSQTELSTAMPKAGGTYFFIERSLGTAFGLFSGLANWFSVAMKSAFALVGMAVFIEIVFRAASQTFAGIPQIDEYLMMKIIAVVCTLFFIVLNILSVKHASRFQVYLVIALLIILDAFIVFGVPSVNVHRFKPFFPEDFGWIAFLSATGTVFVSFGGLTKVASVAEEIKKPSRDLPLGMFLAWFCVSILYFLVVGITVGVTEHEPLANSLTPISDAARNFSGLPGYLVLAVAAMTAFITTANAGVLAASRALFAMSRDQLLPGLFGKINKKFSTPHSSILVTGLFMIAAIVALDLEYLVKTASTLMLMLFTLVNLSLIIMRESRLQSYRPTFKSPFYPFIQIFAIVVYLSLIAAMGLIPLLISTGFIVFSGSWYFLFVSKRVSRRSAVMHIVERVTDKQLQSSGLENELRDILIERDQITQDRFDELIQQCQIIDLPEKTDYQDIFNQIAKTFSEKLDISKDDFYEKLCVRESQGSTVIDDGLAIPHVVIEGDDKFDIMLVRSVEGIEFPHAEKPIHCIFVLAGTKDQRNYHLRALMAIAQIAQQDSFMKKWLTSRDAQTLRNLILLSTRTRQY